MPERWIGIGHRGVPREFPGNTLLGFQRAVELGCAMVECDIRPAADGVLVLAHDPHVTDVNGGTYELAAHSSQELVRLDLGRGEGVPLLTDLVAWAKGRCAVMADMKCEGEGVEEKVAEALTPLPIEAKLVPGAGLESRKRFREIDPTLPLALTLNRHSNVGTNLDEFAALLATIDTEAVTWEYPLLTQERIAALHTHGLKVYAWTVDDRSIMLPLLEAGVDGLITNRPDLLYA